MIFDLIWSYENDKFKNFGKNNVHFIFYYFTRSWNGQSSVIWAKEIDTIYELFRSFISSTSIFVRLVSSTGSSLSYINHKNRTLTLTWKSAEFAFSGKHHFLFRTHWITGNTSGPDLSWSNLHEPDAVVKVSSAGNRERATRLRGQRELDLRPSHR